jgi:hypothetical protein
MNMFSFPLARLPRTSECLQIFPPSQILHARCLKDRNNRLRGPKLDLTVQLIPLTAAFKMNAYLKAAVFECAVAVDIDLIKGKFFLKTNVQFAKFFRADVVVDAMFGQSLKTAACVFFRSSLFFLRIHLSRKPFFSTVLLFSLTLFFESRISLVRLTWPAENSWSVDPSVS